MNAILGSFGLGVGSDLLQFTLGERCKVGAGDGKVGLGAAGLGRTPGDWRFWLLEAVGSGVNVSQRSLAARLGVAVGAVNRGLRYLLENGYLEVVDPAVRPFSYRLTEAGQEYRFRVRQEHYAVVVERFREVEGRVYGRLRELRSLGVRRVVFYGAGVLMELAYSLARRAGLQVVGIVDDDRGKQGEVRRGVRVGAPREIGDLRPEAVVISTIRYGGEIRRRLANLLSGGVLVWEL